MKELNKDNKIDFVNRSRKAVKYSDIEFIEYEPDDDFTYSIKQLFYFEDGSNPIDFVYRQNLLFDDTSNFLLYQIPLKNRVYGIVKGKVKIEVGDYIIIDDEYGNLYEESDEDELVQVGNIFYDSGCIFITSTENFNGTTDNIQSTILSSTVNIEYKKYVEIRERVFVVNVSQNDFNMTTNESWDEDKPLYFNKIYLYNDDHEVVAVGNISRNTPLKNKITLLLESFEVY